MIDVTRCSENEPFRFKVVVREGEGETRHEVTIAPEQCERWMANRHSPEQCVEAAFRFLLDGEPREAILQRFDVAVISRYFPEFERELPGYLAKL